MVINELRLVRGRLGQALKRDGFLFGNAPSPRQIDHPGLYHYDLEVGDGQRRVHLRVNDDRSGVLFIDVTDVIHLNATATEMAWFALEGYPKSDISGLLRSRYLQEDHLGLERDLDYIYDMVESFHDSHDFCPTCAITGTEREPLFALPAGAPYKADLALTYGCNNQCGHCYNAADRFPMPSMTVEMWLQVIDKLYQIGVPHIIFTGGEATLHPDLPQLIHYAESRGMITGLNTNGRRLAYRPYRQTLIDAGLNHVQITLASRDKQLHDEVMGVRSFSQTVRGIKGVLAANIHVITNTTLTRRNSHDVEALIEFLQELGIRTFAMNGMIYSGGGLSNPDALAQEELAPILIRIRDLTRARNMRFLWYTPTEYCRLSPVELDIGAKRCNAGEYTICIEPNGDVLPCQSFYVSAGNILRDSWDDIWRSELFMSFRQRTSHPELAGLPEICLTCHDLALCGGGCRIEREARSDFEAQDSINGQGDSSRLARGLPAPSDLTHSSFIPPPGTVGIAKRGLGLPGRLVPVGNIQLRGKDR